MDLTIKALEEKHPDCEVVDFKMTVNPTEVKGMSEADIAAKIASVDAELAETVRNAKETTLEELMSWSAMPPELGSTG